MDKSQCVKAYTLHRLVSVPVVKGAYGDAQAQEEEIAQEYFCRLERFPGDSPQ